MRLVRRSTFSLALVIGLRAMGTTVESTTATNTTTTTTTGAPPAHHASELTKLPPQRIAITDKFLLRKGFQLDQTASTGTVGHNRSTAEADTTVEDVFSAEELEELGLTEGSDSNIVKEIVLDESQQRCVQLALDGKNMFISGGAGTGKSLVLRDVVRQLKLAKKKVFVCATTGVASLNVGGITLHSFAGIRVTADKPTVNAMVEKAVKSRRAATRFKTAEVLVIDEVSMLDATLLEALDLLAKKHRKSTLPMGGLQIILCGDFMQLPPVVKGSRRDDTPPYAFFSTVWRDLQLHNVVLRQKFRQQTDEGFQLLLDATRTAQLLPQHLQDLRAMGNDSQVGDNYVHIYGSNAEVDAHNLRRFSTLPPRSGDPSTSKLPLLTYQAEDVKVMKGTQINFDEGRFAKEISLKIGTRVMLLSNVNVRGGLVNGATGEVTGFLSPMEAASLVVEAYRTRGKQHKLSDTLRELMAAAGVSDITDAVRLVDGSTGGAFLWHLYGRGTVRGKQHWSLMDLYQQPTALTMLRVCQGVSSIVSEEDAMCLSLPEWLINFPPEALPRFPIVKFEGEAPPGTDPAEMAKYTLVSPVRQEWNVGDDLVAYRAQLPLRHAWAITIHKSQGLTMKKLMVDMTTCFAPGQAYVALSRGVRRDTVRLRNFRPKSVFCCANAKHFDSQLEETSFEKCAPTIAAAATATAATGAEVGTASSTAAEDAALLDEAELESLLTQ